MRRSRSTRALKQRADAEFQAWLDGYMKSFREGLEDYIVNVLKHKPVKPSSGKQPRKRARPVRRLRWAPR